MNEYFQHQQNSANRAVAFTVVALALLGAVHIVDGDRVGLVLALLSLSAGHLVEQLNMEPATKKFAVPLNFGAWSLGLASGLLVLF